MKDMASINWRNIGRWLVTIVPLGIFLTAYVLLLIFVTMHSIWGNLLLGALFTLGGPILWLYVISRFGPVHKIVPSSGWGDKPFWGFVIILATAAWHFVASALAWPEVRVLMAYAPLLVVLFVLWCMGFRRKPVEEEVSLDIKQHASREP